MSVFSPASARCLHYPTAFAPACRYSVEPGYPSLRLDSLFAWSSSVLLLHSPLFLAAAFSLSARPLRFSPHTHSAPPVFPLFTLCLICLFSILWSAGCQSFFLPRCLPIFAHPTRPPGSTFFSALDFLSRYSVRAAFRYLHHLLWLRFPRSTTTLGTSLCLSGLVTTRFPRLHVHQVTRPITPCLVATLRSRFSTVRSLPAYPSTLHFFAFLSAMDIIRCSGRLNFLEYRAPIKASSAYGRTHPYTILRLMGTSF